MINPVTLVDYEILAKNKLPKNIFDFIDSGACDEITKYHNRQAFENIKLRPLCLRDVSSIDTHVELLKHEISMPVIVAPTAFHQMLDNEGEVATAKAAARSSIPMVVSSMSNKSLEEIAERSLNKNLWFQIYIFKNRALTLELIERAQNAGYKALVVTIGAPVMGKRDNNIRNQFSLPAQLSTGNYKSMINDRTIYEFTAQQFDLSLTWHDIEWLLSVTTLPVILKGIINPKDAKQACNLQVAGIVVSNHGGRQLDTTQATIIALPSIVEVITGNTAILIDGGIRRGTDLFKCIALGADAVLLGRPVLWALSIQGESGVVDMLTIMKNEFEITMSLTGCRSIREIRTLSKDIICSL